MRGLHVSLLAVNALLLPLAACGDPCSDSGGDCSSLSAGTGDETTDGEPFGPATTEVDSTVGADGSASGDGGGGSSASADGGSASVSADGGSLTADGGGSLSADGGGSASADGGGSVSASDD